MKLKDNNAGGRVSEKQRGGLGIDVTMGLFRRRRRRRDPCVLGW